MSKCPACDADVSIATSVCAGELVRCSECARELEVIAIEPLELVLAPEIEEDWGE